jgi:hypothetical protein
LVGGAAKRLNVGHFSPIGSNGFWIRGKERAHFDQQPVEAHAMIAACVEAAPSLSIWRT